jgi:hypothetical protein
MRYHISWAFLGYISDLEVTVPFYSVYPVGEGDGRYRLEPDVIKRHSNVQMVDESRENRHFYGSQWVLPVCQSNCAFL